MSRYEVLELVAIYSQLALSALFLYKAKKYTTGYKKDATQVRIGLIAEMELVRSKISKLQNPLILGNALEIHELPYLKERLKTLELYFLDGPEDT